jgi:IPT/TIG domain/Glucodextranase, domain B
VFQPSMRHSATRNFCKFLSAILFVMHLPSALAAAPTITSLSASSAAIGSSVTIVGTNFSSTKTSDVVKFNGTAATVSTATTTQLVVTVPAGATTGALTVTVSGTVSASFSIIPKVSSFTPSSGVVMTSVTVAGSGFSATAASNAVTFNGVAATVTSATATQLIVKVPSGATTGKIAITVGGQLGVSATNFTVTPQILSYSPGLGPVGATVTIAGEGFDTVASNNALTFHNVAASIISATATQLITTVPAGATTGTLKVTVATHSFATTTSFTVTPSITSIDPISGTPQTDVYIDGYNFSATRTSNVVKFNGVQAVVSSATPTELDVLVPDTATTGPITVTVGGTMATSSAPFVVVGPLLDSFTPPSAPPGSTVKIVGENFDTTQPNNVVKFNGVAATILYADENTILATVPATATSGPITVSRFSQSVASATNFAVTTPNVSLPAGVLTQQQTVQAVAHQPIVIEIANVVSPGGQQLLVTILDPAGQTVDAEYVGANAGFMFYIDPPANGSYILNFQKMYGSAAATAQIVYDQGQQATVGGASLHATSPLPGGSVRLNFDAVANSSVTLTQSNVLTQYGYNNLDIDFQLFYPDGTLSSTDKACIYQSSEQNSPQSCEFPNLPQTGTYTLVGNISLNVGPFIGTQGVTFDADVSLSTEPVRTLTLGTPVDVDFSTDPIERLTFSASTGQLVFINSSTTADASGTLVIRDTASAQVVSTGMRFGGTAAFFNPQHSGTYTAIIEKYTNLGTSKIWLDAGSQLGVDASATQVSTGLPGQFVRLNFAASAGQTLALLFTNLVMSSPDDVTFTLLNPDLSASQIRALNLANSCPSSQTTSGGCGWILQNLPQTGTYTLILGPNAELGLSDGVTFSANISLLDDASGLVQLPSLTVSGFSPISGPTGSTVTIRGQHFSPNPVDDQVWFFGASNSVTPSAASANELIVSVPEDAQTGFLWIVVGDESAYSNTDFVIAPTVTPLVSLSLSSSAQLGTDYVLVVNIDPQGQVTYQPTGTIEIDVSNPINHSCEITVPSTTCAFYPQTRGTTTATAIYSGDSHFSRVISQPFTFNVVGIPSNTAITSVAPSNLTKLGQEIVVTFSVMQTYLGSTAPVITGSVGVSDGSGNSCTVGGPGVEQGGGFCVFTPITAGTRFLVARYSGDDVYEPSLSAPISHATSSPGGATVLPPDSEICGFDPMANYPTQPGFTPTAQLRGAVPSAGLALDITGSHNSSISISSPIQGEAIADTTVDVVGTFTGPNNSGIIVNGILADTVNGKFLATGVPLSPGPNTITVVSSTMLDETATAAVTIYQSGTPNIVSIERQGVGSAGFAPATQRFSYSVGSLPNQASLQSVSVDYDGDGQFDWTGTDIAQAPNLMSYSTPGLYTLTLKVVDSHNSVFLAQRPVLVQDLAMTRSVVCDVYGYLKNRLAAQDATTASLAFDIESRADFQNLFISSNSYMSTMPQQLGVIASGFFGQGYAELTLVRDNPDHTRNGFPLRMKRGQDGVWRISEM